MLDSQFQYAYFRNNGTLTLAKSRTASRFFSTKFSMRTEMSVGPKGIPSCLATGKSAVVPSLLTPRLA